MGLARLTRRRFLSASACSAFAAVGGPLHGQLTPDAPPPKPSTRAANAVEAKLDAYVAGYMTAMNAPGMTLGLTDSSKTLRAVGYGLANVDAKRPVTPDHLFEIGSISKSFVALALLQLREEGKLDLHKPILDYLPWLPIAEPFGPIEVRHLLSHTSGLPDAGELFLSGPEGRHTQGFAPGDHFHYCNLGFGILGQLAAKLDGRPWRECVRARILVPLDMDATEGVITTAARARAAVGYEPFWDDEVYARQGRLAVSGNLVTDHTAGCIQSTPGDMAKYLRMMLNRGKGPRGRIVSEESFALFSTPYIKAEEFSPTASYGYGVAVDTLDGHTILRHTGGMISFASSMHVDLDGGIAAFASINAMQGYRPIAVTEYAVRLLRAEREAKPLPEAAALTNAEEVKDAADYAGTFTAADGGELVFRADEDRLSLQAEGKSIPLQRSGADTFISTVPGVFASYGLVFQRDVADSSDHVSAKAGKNKAATPGKVVQVGYGPRWYAGQGYSGPSEFAVSDDYGAFVGRYRSDSAWGGDARAFVRQGKLFLLDTELTRIGGGLFRLGDEGWNPDTVEFLCVAEGKARLVKIVGMDFWRVEIP